jgi:predicted enzyme related to lactoylglutathione lyase
MPPGVDRLTAVCPSRGIDRPRRSGWDNKLVPVIDIDHVQIAGPTGCEPEARRFFGNLLGLTEIEKPEPLRTRGGCWFRIGARQLHIGIADPFRPAIKAHPAFLVSGIEAMVTALEQAGVHVIWGETLGGISRRFYASDPWGNRLEFTESTHP